MTHISSLLFHIVSVDQTNTEMKFYLNYLNATLSVSSLVSNNFIYNSNVMLLLEKLPIQSLKIIVFSIEESSASKGNYLIVKYKKSFRKSNTFIFEITSLYIVKIKLSIRSKKVFFVQMWFSSELKCLNWKRDLL